jgi:hypothetical protein
MKEHVQRIILAVCTHGCEYMIQALSVRTQYGVVYRTPCTLDYSDRDLPASSDMEGIGACRNTFPCVSTRPYKTQITP